MTSFSKEDLLASLSLGAESQNAETIGCVMNLEDLERQCRELSMAANDTNEGGGWKGVRPSRAPTSDSSNRSTSPSKGPTRAGTNVRKPHARYNIFPFFFLLKKYLIFFIFFSLSITGRPEEIYKEIKKKTGKNESTIIGNYVRYFSLFFFLLVFNIFLFFSN